MGWDGMRVWQASLASLVASSSAGEPPSLAPRRAATSCWRALLTNRRAPALAEHSNIVVVEIARVNLHRDCAREGHARLDEQRAANGRARGGVSSRWLVASDSRTTCRLVSADASPTVLSRFSSSTASFLYEVVNKSHIPLRDCLRSVTRARLQEERGRNTLR